MSNSNSYSFYMDIPIFPMKGGSMRQTASILFFFFSSFQLFSNVEGQSAVKCSKLKVKLRYRFGSLRQKLGKLLSTSF
jgi:hypothetical protein